jgi:hypothetical protein
MKLCLVLEKEAGQKPANTRRAPLLPVDLKIPFIYMTVGTGRLDFPEGEFSP